MPNLESPWMLPLLLLALMGFSIAVIKVRDGVALVAHEVRVARRMAARGYGRTLPAVLWELAVGLHRHRARRASYQRLYGEIEELQIALDKSRDYGDKAAAAATSAAQQLAILEALVCHGPLSDENLLEYGGRVGMAPKATASAALSLLKRGTVASESDLWALRAPSAYQAGAITGASLLAEAETEAATEAEAAIDAEDHIDLRA